MSAAHLTRTNHNCEETGVMISEPVFQSLTEDQRKAIVQAIDEVTDWRNVSVVSRIIPAGFSQVKAYC